MRDTSLETCVTAEEARANTSSGQREHFVGKREHIWQQREHIWGQTEHIRDQIEHLFTMSPVRTRGSGGGSRFVRRALRGRARTLREAAPAEGGDWGRRLAKRLRRGRESGQGGRDPSVRACGGRGLAAGVALPGYRRLCSPYDSDPCPYPPEPCVSRAATITGWGMFVPPADSHQRGAGADGLHVGRVDRVAHGHPRAPDRERRRVHIHAGTRRRQAGPTGGRRASERHRPGGGGHTDAGIRLSVDGQPGAGLAGRHAGRRVRPERRLRRVCVRAGRGPRADRIGDAPDDSDDRVGHDVTGG